MNTLASVHACGARRKRAGLYYKRICGPDSCAHADLRARVTEKRRPRRLSCASSASSTVNGDRSVCAKRTELVLAAFMVPTEEWSHVTPSGIAGATGVRLRQSAH